MRKRIYLKKKYILRIKKNRKNIFLLTIIMVLIVSYLVIKIVGDLAVPPLKKYAKNEANKLTNIVVTRTIEKIVNDDLNVDELYIINMDANNNINMIDFNTIEVNSLLTNVITEIQNNLQNIQDGNIDKINMEELGLQKYDKNNLERGIIYRIPLGIISNNTILSNLGPMIPVKVNLNGEISGNISTKVTNYGINNALIETIIHLEINQLVMLPISSDEIKVTSEIPIAMKLVQGIVPNYYFNGIDKNSNTLTVPIE